MSDSAPVTGLARLDEAVQVLADLDEAPISDHPALFDAAHQALRDTLVHAADQIDDAVIDDPAPEA